MENKETTKREAAKTEAAPAKKRTVRKTNKTAAQPAKAEEKPSEEKKAARKPRTTKTPARRTAKKTTEEVPETPQTEAVTTPLEQSATAETQDTAPLQTTEAMAETPAPAVEASDTASPKEQKKEAEAPQEARQVEKAVEKPQPKPGQKQEIKIPSLPKMTITSIVELAQAPMRNIVLTDQQIQQLTLEEIAQRHCFLKQTLARVLDYDVVISDTNIWLELLVGHSSSHSDPKVNARLQFERQLEFISKLMLHRGGRFMIMGETYEEIDRFATMQDPTNHSEADFTDNIVCLNTAARLAKRLILAQQRENRLRIDGIGAESHHAAFADPAIIRKVADLFAAGKKVLLLTNDTSVAIRTMGICDDLQRHNNIPDEEWDGKYAPLRPMVFTFDDLKLLDHYTRQYHYIQMAAGEAWMQDVDKANPHGRPEALELWTDAFRPGDKHRGDNLFTEQEKQKKQKKQQEQQKRQAQQQKQQQQKNAQKQQEAAVRNEPTQTAAAPTPQPEQPTQEPPQAENSEEQKPKSRSRRRSSRGRRGGADKSAETSEKSDNA